MSSSDSSDGLPTPPPGSPPVAVLDLLPKTLEVGIEPPEKTSTLAPVEFGVNDASPSSSPSKEQQEQPPRQADEGDNSTNDTGHIAVNVESTPDIPEAAEPLTPEATPLQEAQVPDTEARKDDEPVPVLSAPLPSAAAAVEPTPSFFGWGDVTIKDEDSNAGDQGEDSDADSSVDEDSEDTTSSEESDRNDDDQTPHDPFDRQAELSSISSNPTENSMTESATETKSGDPMMTARKLWEEMKKRGEESAALDRLMDLVGLENVKMQFLKIKAIIDEARRRKGWLRYQDLNIAFLGNPGTGKTTVANLYKDFLDECKIWPDAHDTSTKQFFGFTFQSKEDVEGFYRDSDWKYWPQGAIIIDEIDRGERDHHSYLANALSDLPEKRVIILTGSVLGVSKVLGHRPQSRWECWRRIRLPDYTDEQLKVMLVRLIDRNNLLVDGGAESPYPTLVARRVGRGRNTEGFGNMHEVVLAFEQMLERQAERLRLDPRNWPPVPAVVEEGEEEKDGKEEGDSSVTQPVDVEGNASNEQSTSVEPADADPGKSPSEVDPKPVTPIDTEENASKDDSEPVQPSDSENTGSEKNPEAGQPEDTPEEQNEEKGEEKGRRQEEVYKPVLIMSDFMGPEPAKLWEESPAWKELSQMAGLEDVKKAVRSLMRRSKTNYHRELRGKEPLQMSLNRLFLGPPGTGKTTVAKLYGQILGELGLVSSNEVIFTTPSDFIGPYTGQTETRTSSIVDSASGKVLIIDDAHTFFTRDETSVLGDDLDSFRRACIDTLVSRIHNKPGEDRCVILIGYADKMEDMFQKCNPGLKRRFPLEEAFRFNDYDDGQLNEILRIKMDKEEITASKEALKVAAEVLRRARDRPNFGNGGDVDNLLNQAKTRFRERKAAEKGKKGTKKKSGSPRTTKTNDTAVLGGDGDDSSSSTDDGDEDRTETVLEPQDFDPEWDRGTNPASGSKASSLFDGLLGFDDIRRQFEGYQLMAANMRRRGKDPRESIPFTYVFKGPPGTGKTHTARIMGKMFYRMGFLSTDEVVECSASHLIGQYTGQTAPKVISLLDSALGKVLFIDEAYRLTSIGGRGFESEAIGELVDSMTKPRYLRKMIIILAGYNKDMNLLLKSNAGLRGRFPTEIRFKPMDEELSRAHLIKLLGKQDIEIYDVVKPSSDDHETVLRLLHKLGMTEGWSNGRDIQSLANVITAEVYRSMSPPPVSEAGADEGDGDGRKDGAAESSEKLNISTKRLIKFLKDMLRERIKAGTGTGSGENAA